MSNRVFTQEQIDKVVGEIGIQNLGKATIGEMVLLAQGLQRDTGIEFIRMDQGVPGLDPCRVGTEGEKVALDGGCPAVYPPAEGVSALKEESSRFVKAFLDLEVSPMSCIPVTGSVAGSFAAFIACTQCMPGRDTILFIDPGFPIQKAQLKILDIKYEQFDIYEFRGEALREKLESYMAKGNIAAILYSNPNNPAWICLTEQELEIVGELSMKHEVVVLEDLAYFGMDYRTDYGVPFESPYVPTAAKYTENYILLLTSSKIFSYAGQRIGVSCVSDKLYNRRFEALAKRYSGSGIFGPVMTASILYMITSGVTHSTQYGYAAMLKAASDGKYNFVTATSEYGRRAHRMKELFLKYGFNVVYDKDVDRDIADGFFFTIGYKDMSCGELLSELLYYGISSIALSTTGSEQQGVRACCSRMRDDLYDVLDKRLEAFAKDHN